MERWGMERGSNGERKERIEGGMERRRNIVHSWQHNIVHCLQHNIVHSWQHNIVHCWRHNIVHSWQHNIVHFWQHNIVNHSCNITWFTVGRTTLFTVGNITLFTIGSKTLFTPVDNLQSSKYLNAYDTVTSINFLNRIILSKYTYVHASCFNAKKTSISLYKRRASIFYFFFKTRLGNML